MHKILEYLGIRMLTKYQWLNLLMNSGNPLAYNMTLRSMVLKTCNIGLLLHGSTHHQSTLIPIAHIGA